MVFSGIPFLFCFLPLLLLIYYAIPQSARAWRNHTLLAASLLFYAWGEGLQLLLLLCSIGANHLLARLLVRETTTLSPRLVLTFAVFFNICLLTWYKYAGFIAISLGFNDWVAPGLPLGISFFTFQAISYLVDIYRKEAKASESVLTTALYISSFPQLIAGPIVRYKYVATQITHRQESIDKAFLGVQVFILGLAQKVLIANTVGETADAAFNLNIEQLDLFSAWVGLLAYGLHIYFDFAGYSNMAIGLGLLLGFSFPRNFNAPYSAQSVTEFWRRWHMTLSEWFRDYLYIPLGGNRKGPARTIINLWLVFLLCGLWHGAALNFIAWGAWHGFFLSIERLGLGSFLRKLWRPLRHVYLLLTIFLGWVLFRANSLEHALEYYTVLLSGPLGSAENLTPLPLNLPTTLFLIACLLISMLSISRSKENQGPQSWLTYTDGTSGFSIAGGVLLLGTFVVCVSALVASSFNPFIYFRF